MLAQKRDFNIPLSIFREFVTLTKTLNNMKKLILISILIISCILLPAQNRRKEYYRTRQISDSIYKAKVLNRSAGDELQLFSKNYYIGSAISLGGGILMVAGAGKPDVGMVTAGGVICVIGFIETLSSVGHVKRAGLLLNKNGIGIKIPIK